MKFYKVITTKESLLETISKCSEGEVEITVIVEGEPTFDQRASGPGIILVVK